MRTTGRIASGAAVAVAVVVLVLGVELGVRTAAPRPVGAVSWSDATVPSRAARSVTVLADVHRVRRERCDLLTGRPEVEESGTAVRIRLEVFAAPGPQGRVCTLLPQIRLRATVRLAAPLGTRTLIDTVDGRTRPVHIGAPAGSRARGGSPSLRP